jgi:hypothetical protein
MDIANTALVVVQEFGWVLVALVPSVLISLLIIRFAFQIQISDIVRELEEDQNGAMTALLLGIAGGLTYVISRSVAGLDTAEILYWTTIAIVMGIVNSIIFLLPIVAWLARRAGMSPRAYLHRELCQEDNLAMGLLVITPWVLTTIVAGNITLV